MPLNGVKVFQVNVDWSSIPTSKSVDFYLMKVKNLGLKATA